MHTMTVVILLELSQFSLQATCVPEKYVVEIFAANGSDQSFDCLQSRSGNSPERALKTTSNHAVKAEQDVGLLEITF